jgi:hypothetical protein
MKQVKYEGAEQLSLLGSVMPRNRRKSYFHGKYNREVLTVIMLIAFISLILLRG